ncbi:hypothetical protein PMG11_03301 [Penicillium brasilianum]|uniref:Homeobox domain-containing protein n=1 Tax=Penicillium brasilianum TaxID=104259 RepID=A0A0F7V9S7_PENBI|nr:hypothetical protein PMG11_03301 [Penicillium brasilianum]
MAEPSSVDEFESSLPSHGSSLAGLEPISWGDVATYERNAVTSLVQHQPRLDIDLLAEEQLASLLAETDIVNTPHNAIGASSMLWPAKNTLPPKSGNRFNPAALKLLKRWFANHEDHPYPTSDDIQQLEVLTSLSQKQIQNWFSNMRRRSKNLRSNTDSGIFSRRTSKAAYAFTFWKHESASTMGELSARTRSCSSF